MAHISTNPSFVNAIALDGISFEIKPRVEDIRETHYQLTLGISDDISLSFYYRVTVVSCTLTDTTMSSPLQDINYEFAGPKATYALPPITQTPECGYSIASITFPAISTGIISFNH